MVRRTILNYEEICGFINLFGEFDIDVVFEIKTMMTLNDTDVRIDGSIGRAAVMGVPFEISMSQDITYKPQQCKINFSIIKV